MSMLSRFRLALLVLLVLTIQRTILDGVVIDHAHPDAMLLVPLLIAYLEGPEKGAVAGFVIGLLTDVFLPTPFGLTALTLTVVAYYVGALKPNGQQSQVKWPVPLVVAGASAVQVAFFAVLGRILGQPAMLTNGTVAIVAVVAIANGVLALPVLKAVSWAVGDASHRRRPAARRGAPGSARTARNVVVPESRWRSA